MKLLVPFALALLGLGAGIGAGFALKPPPPESHAAEDCEALGHGAHASAEDGHEAGPGDDHASGLVDPCLDFAALDPFEPIDEGAGGQGTEEAEHALFVPLEKPFVVPVFAGEKVVSMVVLSVSVSARIENPDLVMAIEPRLRDRLLEAMFQHSNTGGFDGSFTTGRKIEDLKIALLRAAQSVMGKDLITEVLITEINRQDV
ncbi:MAG: flagellar basal body-associated FliL family protein [Pseudomonadota bacterium]